MDASGIKTVGVIGLGVMGSGIAEVFCRAGFQVRAAEASPALLAKGLASLEKSFTRAVEKGRITQEEKDACLSRLTGVESLEGLSDCDLVVEAAKEDMSVKKQIFAELDACVKREALLASNTSSLSITEMAAATSRPGQVLGLHFFNPVPVMALVEVVTGTLTAPDTIETGRGLVERLTKKPVVVKDRPGFVVNLLLIPYLCDAIRWFDAGLATADEIDTSIKLGLSHPIGPLALSDLIGLDVVLFIADSLYDELREQRYAAPAVLRRMVSAGLLGRKSGKGFYTYTK